MKKKIGIIGGIAWQSTVEYYRTICQLSQARFAAEGGTGPADMPEFSIESVNIRESQSRRGVAGDKASWARFDAYFQAALQRLQASGADFAVIASNTPHNRFDAITRGLDMPVLCMFEVVAQACRREGVGRLLILGTEPTMSLPAFPAVLQRHGVQGRVPTDTADRALVHRLIEDLQAGRGDGAAARLHDLVQRSVAAEPGGRPVVALACTELPLAFPAHADDGLFEAGGVLYLNTTALHARAAFDYAFRA